MTEQNIDLKQLERKVWTSFYEDGIWDIYLGILLMAMAVGAFLADIRAAEAIQLATYSSLVGIACVFIIASKRYITLPRIGLVEFGSKGRARKRKASIVFAMSVIIGIVVFILVALSARGSLDSRLHMYSTLPLIWFGTLIVVFGLAAFFLRYNRLYLIGVMFAIAVPLDVILRRLTHHDLSYLAFGLPALVILVIGSVVLVRFLRKYPKPSGGMHDVR